MTTFWSAMVNGAILSALLAAAVWLALRATPRHSLNAATRYAIWWMVLAVTLALPLSYVKWRTGQHDPEAQLSQLARICPGWGFRLLRTLQSPLASACPCKFRPAHCCARC